MWEQNCRLVVQVTIDEDGNCLDGSDPETFAPRLEEWGADVIGCNCSVGPVAMLDAIERVRPLTSLPLSAQPNAGIPRSVEGRNIYLCSPGVHGELCAQVRCGGSAHRGRMLRNDSRPYPRDEIRTAGRGSEGKTASAQVAARHAPTPRPAQPLEERSLLGAKLARGEFVTMVEVVPPKGTDIRKELEGSRFLKSVGVDAVNIPDSPRASARMSNQALSLLVQREAGIDAILHYTCRDRNVLCIQSDLLGAAAVGIKNLICITGDPPKMGNYPDATAVFDVDAIGLVNIVHNLNRGLDIGGNPIGAGTGFVIGVGANPGLTDLDEEIRRFEYKVAAGAEYAVTQPVFDIRLAGELSAADRALPHSRGGRNLAAGQRAQRRVHEERTPGLGAGLDSGTHGASPNAGGRKSRRRGDRARNAGRRSAHGAGSADQRAAGTLQLGGRRS